MDFVKDSQCKGPTIYIHIYPYIYIHIYHYLQYKYIWYMFSGPNIPETLSSRETLLAEVAAICIKYPPCTAPWSLQNSLEKTGLGCVYVGLMLGPFGSHIHPYSVYLLFKPFTGTNMEIGAHISIHIFNIPAFWNPLEAQKCIPNSFCSGVPKIMFW